MYVLSSHRYSASKVIIFPNFYMEDLVPGAGTCIAKHFGNVVEEDSTHQRYSKITLPNNNFKNGI